MNGKKFHWTLLHNAVSCNLPTAPLSEEHIKWLKLIRDCKFTHFEVS